MGLLLQLQLQLSKDDLTVWCSDKILRPGTDSLLVSPVLKGRELDILKMSMMGVANIRGAP